MAQTIFEPNLLLYKYSNIFKTCHPSYLSAYKDGTDSVPKRRHIKFRCRGITQKKAYKTLHIVTMLGTEGFKAASNGWRILPRTDSYTHLMRQLSLRLPPDKTLNLKGNPCNGRKNSKERITVALAYNAYGTDKLPALVSRQQ
jgi:hypothetical protein